MSIQKSLQSGARLRTLMALLVASPLALAAAAPAWSDGFGGPGPGGPGFGGPGPSGPGFGGPIPPFGAPVPIFGGPGPFLGGGGPGPFFNFDGPDDDAYDIGLWGDLPYSNGAQTDQQLTGVPNIIKSMNAHDLAFTAHDGDLRQGSGNPSCGDDLYSRSLTMFNSMKAPAIFTPGDNDWTDCDRVGFDAKERLDFERKTFFSTPFTLGQHRFKQDVQTGLLCLGANGAFVQCAENRRWVIGRVTYATLNVQGSCNNLCAQTGADVAEFTARNAANIKWLQDTFAEAKKNHSVAVMLITQADPGFDNTGTAGSGLGGDKNTLVLATGIRDPRTLVETDVESSDDPETNRDGFKTYLLALRKEVIDFGKPVVYVHGDSHYFRIDQPFLDANGFRLENFTRLETFGDNAQAGNNDARWVKVHVDPKSPDVFSFQPINVPGNRTPNHQP